MENNVFERICKALESIAQSLGNIDKSIQGHNEHGLTTNISFELDSIRAAIENK